MDELKTKNVVVKLEGVAYDLYEFLVKHNDKIRNHQATYIKDAAVQGMLETIEHHVSGAIKATEENSPDISKTEIMDMVEEATRILMKAMVERTKQIRNIRNQEGGELL
jgi:hypothetical protein